MTVKSTYNFVPAPTEDEVFKPDWADKVSHDIPFKDGESGEITLNIKAETPIFIRNGHAEGKEDNEFSHIKVEENGELHKKYFIPASSLKGMIRNVLEIMSRGRIKQIANDRYSFRDLTRNSLYMNSYNSNDVECGWLREDKEGKWTIEDCQYPARISHIEVDNILGTDFRNSFLNTQPREKTAKYKYDQVSNKNNLIQKFNIIIEEHNEIAIKNSTGNEGTIVFTGQSGRRNEVEGQIPSGKFYEFVFFQPTKNIIVIEDKQKTDFNFIYNDHDKNNISKDWKYWKKKLENGGKVPVFFNRETVTTVKHFGLAYMYKLPYNKSIHETLPYVDYEKNKKDLVELIFGSTDKKLGLLKGRIMFSHAFANNATAGTIQREILGSPKASYYPFYLTQPNTRLDHNAYMNENAKIRGYKRYPVHKSGFNGKTGVYNHEQERNDNVFSSLIPLNAGAEFSCKIRFHNLRKAEIGALLSAITFHDNSDKLFHSLGGAKSYGYGKIKVDNIKLKFLKHSQLDYMLSFEEMMVEKFPVWINSSTLIELAAMASSPVNDYVNNNLVYPQLKLAGVPPRNANEFINYKREGLSLEKYSAQNPPTMLKSIAKKLENESIINKGGYELENDSLKKLEKQLKDEFGNNIPEALVQQLEDTIKFIYNNHGASNRQLNNNSFDANYKWINKISTWLGPEKAKALYKELTGKDE